MIRTTPATPPMIPPTRSLVGGMLLPPPDPEPEPELVVAAGGELEVAVPPTMPPPRPVLEAAAEDCAAVDDA